LGRGPGLIISWSVRYAAARVRPTWLLGRGRVGGVEGGEGGSGGWRTWRVGVEVSWGG